MNIPENMKEITDLASQLVNPILPQMEDFVTLEITKKLKEKGFPIKTKTEGKFGLTKVKEVDICPTISQVLKWLREEKGYHICIGYDGIYSYDVVRIIDCEFAGADDDYDTYEQATLTGIEYVIDNLI